MDHVEQSWTFGWTACSGHLPSSWGLEEKVNSHSSSLLLPWSHSLPSEGCCTGGKWDLKPWKTTTWMRLKISEILEDHQLSLEAEPQETFQISDIAEELATSWRDKRQEPNCLQKNRQFGKARYVCRAYRIEVEELKRNTACHKCGKRGHWARECRSAPAKGQGEGNKSQAAPSVMHPQVLRWSLCPR